MEQLFILILLSVAIGLLTIGGFRVLSGLTASALLIAATLPAHANDMHAMLKGCAEKTEAAERLECFDRVAAVSKALASLRTGDSPAAPSPEWQIQESRDPIDDSPTIHAVQTVEGTGLFKAMVSARCVRGKTELIVKWPLTFSLGSDGEAITTRIGSEAPETKRWNRSTDGSASFYPEWPGTFLTRAIKADKIAFRRGQHDAVFSTAGLDKAVAKISAACTWPADIAKQSK